MCFLFLDKYGKEIKKGAKACGQDRGQTRQWLKFYRRVRKQVPLVTGHYHLVRDVAGKILAEAKDLEQLLIQGEKKDLSDFAEQFRRQQEQLDFQFLIGKEDKEIHSTLDGLIRLLKGYPSGETDPLLLQSETENLIAMIGEAMTKEKPDLFELSSYYVGHSDQELTELSHSRQLERVHDLFEEEFVAPIRPVLETMKGELAETYLKEMTTI